MGKVKLNNLPWWGTREHFSYLNKTELEDRFDRFPIRKSLIFSFVNNYVSTVWLMDFSSSGPFEGIIHREAPFDSLNFNISLNAYYPLEEISSTFIHECLHGIYAVNSRGVEDIIIEQESKFYHENKDFSIKILEKNLGKFNREFSEDIFNRNKELLKKD